MLRFLWNALRVGDKVHVHDISHQEMRLLPGEVMIVQHKRDANSLEVRVTLPDGNTAVVRPEWLSVHLDPFDGKEKCWRCDEMVAAGHAVV